MQNLLNPSGPLLSSYVKTFRAQFETQRDHLAKAISSNDETKNELLLELHFLFNELYSFFDEVLNTEGKQINAKIFSGPMPTIPEGSSQIEISSPSLQREAIIHRAADRTPQQATSPINLRHKPMTSIDNLHREQKSGQSHLQEQKIQESEGVIHKYKAALKTIQGLTHQRAKLEQKLSELNEKLVTIEKEKGELGIQKKYCLDLLVRHSDKNERIEDQNRQLKTSLTQYEQRCRQLSSEVMEKSQLLEEIREFLKGEDESQSEIKTRRGEGLHTLSDSQILSQNQRLAIELARVNEELQAVTQESNQLKQRQGEMQADMDLLLRDNQSFYKVIQQLKTEATAQRNKNRESLKIEEGKRLNEMIHRQNRHLLQVNYELSNKVQHLQGKNQKLIKQLQRLQSTVEKSYHKSPNITQDETMSYTPMNKSKFSAKANNSGEKFLPSINIPSADVDERARFYEQSWRMEKEKNRELENKVGELLEEMAAYEEELMSKRQQIERLNASIAQDKHYLSSYESKGNKGSEECLEPSFNTVKVNTESKSEDGMYMSLQQFTQRFEPSLMDILFIMLRVSQLSQTLLESGRIYGIYPTNIYVALDDPDHPQNIHVKMEEDQGESEETLLFEAPEIVTSELQIPNQQSVMWNIGMVFHYLVYKSPYFESLQELIEQQNVVKLSQAKFPEAEVIIEAMLQRDPSDRAPLRDVLEEIAYQINRMFEEEQEQEG